MIESNLIQAVLLYNPQQEQPLIDLKDLEASLWWKACSHFKMIWEYIQCDFVKFYFWQNYYHKYHTY